MLPRVSGVPAIKARGWSRINALCEDGSGHVMPTDTSEQSVDCNTSFEIQEHAARSLFDSTNFTVWLKKERLSIHDGKSLG